MSPQDFNPRPLDLGVHISAYVLYFLTNGTFNIMIIFDPILSCKQSSFFLFIFSGTKPHTENNEELNTKGLMRDQVKVKLTRIQCSFRLVIVILPCLIFINCLFQRALKFDPHNRS